METNEQNKISSNTLLPAGWLFIDEYQPKMDERVLVYPTEENVVISQLTLIDGIKCWKDDDHNSFNYETVKWWQELPKKPTCW